MKLRGSLVLCLLAMTSWAAHGGHVGSYTDGVSLRAVADSNNLFMADMYNILKGSHAGNFLFSPFALSTQLGMLKQGAGGNTSDEIQKTSLFAYDDPTIFKGYYGLLKLYKLTPATKDTNNQILMSEDFSPNFVFQKVIETYFDGKFKKVTNLTEATVEDIVEKIKDHKYKGLLSAVFLDNRLAFNLASTFRSKWENQFNVNTTFEGTFYKKGLTKSPAQMMNVEAELEIADFPHLDAKAISIPLDESQLNLIILLPNALNGIDQLEKQLKEYSFHLISDRLLKADLLNVSFTMPKFSLKSSLDLYEPLEDMGMRTLFYPEKANLTGIPLLRSTAEKGYIPLHVTEFLHSAQLDFNEAGIFGDNTAVPDTSIESLELEDDSPKGKAARNLVKFTADHPFIGYVHDWITDTVLYVFRKVE